VASFSSLLVVGLTSLYDPENMSGQAANNAEIGVLSYHEKLIGLMKGSKKEFKTCEHYGEGWES